MKRLGIRRERGKQRKKVEESKRKNCFRRFDF